MTPTAVLLNVDDHEAARYARSRILSSAGFRVHDAGSGKETLDLARKLQPDLVLLDVHLPDVDGIEVCRQLKEAQLNTSVMVLQISASALSAAHAKEALDAGADAYLMEPVDPDVLVATVRALLRLHLAERSLMHANRQLEILNKELQRSNQDLQQFAIAASHDLQDPLRTMSIYTQLITQELGDQLSEQHKGYLKWVTDGTTRMQALIHDLLAYSQVGREGRAQAIVDLNGVAQAAIAELAEQLQMAGGVIEIPQPLPSVWGDQASLVSLVQNLLSNSIKYRSPDRTLAIQIHATQTSPVEWTIRVTDNGIGISPDYHEHIFRPFKRLHGFGIPGSGVGLALCQRIVEEFGGRIWVESVPDEGSSFCFTLRAA
jgi:signal transduction histidine kinase